MLKFIIKRLLQAIPLLILVTIISYFIICMAPGDPVYTYVDPLKAQNVDLNVVRHNLGLDKPIYIRYFYWLGNILKGNLGYSYFNARPVLKIIGEALPNTLCLTLTSLLFTLLVAIPAGIIAALHRNKFWDYFFSGISFIGMSLPTFWFGLIMILFFSLKLGWFPTAGMRENYEQFVLSDRISHLILPSIVLGMSFLAQFMKYMRASMLEVIGQDYIRTARSKGLSEKIVILKHALRNALLPIITALGIFMPVLFGGAAITETIFSWPGVGRILVNASFTRDYPLMMADVLIAAIFVIVGNLLADIFYAVADPRIKYS